MIKVKFFQEELQEPVLNTKEKSHKQLKERDIQLFYHTLQIHNKMEVILIKDVPGLGFQDEKVIVKDGYGRNYLIPQGLCVLANKSNSKILEEKLKQTVKKQEEVLKTAQKIAKKIGDLVLELSLIHI